MIAPPATRPDSSSELTPPSSNPAERARQPDRDRLIKQLISQGIFTKVEYRPGGLPHLYVDRAFHLLKVDEKRGFVHLVWSYYITEDSGASIVVLHDGYSGKEIGKYDETWGLRLK